MTEFEWNHTNKELQFQWSTVECVLCSSPIKVNTQILSWQRYFWLSSIFFLLSNSNSNLIFFTDGFSNENVYHTIVSILNSASEHTLLWQLLRYRYECAKTEGILTFTCETHKGVKVFASLCGVALLFLLQLLRLLRFGANNKLMEYSINESPDNEVESPETKELIPCTNFTFSLSLFLSYSFVRNSRSTRFSINGIRRKFAS